LIVQIKKKIVSKDLDQNFKKCIFFMTLKLLGEENRNQLLALKINKTLMEESRNLLGSQDGLEFQ
jgi:hypothetical protein